MSSRATPGGPEPGWPQVSSKTTEVPTSVLWRGWLGWELTATGWEDTRPQALSGSVSGQPAHKVRASGQATSHRAQCSNTQETPCPPIYTEPTTLPLRDSQPAAPTWSSQGLCPRCGDVATPGALEAPPSPSQVPVSEGGSFGRHSPGSLHSWGRRPAVQPRPQATCSPAACRALRGQRCPAWVPAHRKQISSRPALVSKPLTHGAPSCPPLRHPAWEVCKSCQQEAQVALRGFLCSVFFSSQQYVSSLTPDATTLHTLILQPRGPEPGPGV